METNKKVPAIRFKGFEEEWNERRLGEIGDTFTGLSGKTKKDFGHGQGKFVTYMNVFSNPISKLNQVEPIEIDNSQNSVNEGDVLFTTSSETPEEVGMSSVWLGKEENVYLNSFCFGYRPNSKIDSYYLAYMLRSTSFRKKITFLAQGISRYNISKNKVMEISISNPQITEQTQIGNYFKALDDLIRLQEQRLKKVTNLKKVMLDKMFPKENADIPEIRFKGFTAKWKRKKLGEVAESFEYGLNAAAISYDGVNKYLRITDIDEKSHQFNFGDLTSPDVDLSTADNYKLRKGDLLFARTGASVGKTYLYREHDGLVYFAGFLIRARIKSDYESEFIFQNTLRSDYLNYVRITSQRSGQPGVNAKEYSNYEIIVPSIEEQQKIAIYFQNLDQLISQSQEKIKKLKNLKQALLQKMFI